MSFIFVLTCLELVWSWKKTFSVWMHLFILVIWIPNIVNLMTLMTCWLSWIWCSKSLTMAQKGSQSNTNCSNRVNLITTMFFRWFHDFWIDWIIWIRPTALMLKHDINRIKTTAGTKVAFVSVLDLAVKYCCVGVTWAVYAPTVVKQCLNIS